MCVYTIRVKLQLVARKNNSDVMFASVMICYKYNYYYNRIINANYILHRDFLNDNEKCAKAFHAITYIVFLSFSL